MTRRRPAPPVAKVVEDKCRSCSEPISLAQCVRAAPQRRQDEPASQTCGTLSSGCVFSSAFTSTKNRIEVEASCSGAARRLAPRGQFTRSRGGLQGRVGRRADDGEERRGNRDGAPIAAIAGAGRRPHPR